MVVRNDYDGPDKPNKGELGGACNRSLCQQEPAEWYNHGTRRYYCEACADWLNTDKFIRLRSYIHGARTADRLAARMGATFVPFDTEENRHGRQN